MQNLVSFLKDSLKHLLTNQKAVYFFFSWLIVAFGQPAWFPLFGLVASTVGFAIFWSVIVDINSWKINFFLSSLWFALVQLVQLSWLISHPFLYIYILYLFLSLAFGMQFGALSLFINRPRLSSFRQMLALAGLWVIMEWARLFVLSGFSFNPVGIALTTSIYGLQNASIFGVFGLSFLVILINLLVLSYWLEKSRKALVQFLGVLLIPLIYGVSHYHYHEKQLTLNTEPPIKALLVQTAFPVEENLRFDSFDEAIQYAEGEWKKILETVKDYWGKPYDILALPEYVVVYGTYLPIYPFEEVRDTFKKNFGESALNKLPVLQEPLAVLTENLDKPSWMVTNAYWAQALSNLFEADLVIGLQDDQWLSEVEKQSFSAAFYFWPGGVRPLRYEKRVLVPMGEYIPFSFCREIAKGYGICSSFTCGESAKVFPGKKAPFGLSICYEETYADLMRESREFGAEMLVNITSDVWFPNSKLPKQHFDHARLRTVESGIPLLRSCNTGVTGACDSVGRVTAILGDESNKDEWTRAALSVEVPSYHYHTLYSKYGDRLIVGLSFFAILFLLGNPFNKKNFS